MTDATKIPSRCCHAFFLPDTRTIAAFKDQFRTTLGWVRNNLIDGVRTDRHVETLRTLQFLIPLQWKDLTPAVRATVDPQTRSWLLEGEGHRVWGCKFLDPETGTCRIYEHRPGMCKTFPTNDVSNNQDGCNRLCRHCASTYCGFHPEHVK